MIFLKSIETPSNEMISLSIRRDAPFRNVPAPINATWNCFFFTNFHACKIGGKFIFSNRN